MSKKKNMYKKYEDMSMDDVIASYASSKAPKKSYSINDLLNEGSKEAQLEEPSVGDFVNGILNSRADEAYRHQYLGEPARKAEVVNNEYHREVETETSNINLSVKYDVDINNEAEDIFVSKSFAESLEVPEMKKEEIKEKPTKGFLDYYTPTTVSISNGNVNINNKFGVRNIVGIANNESNGMKVVEPLDMVKNDIITATMFIVLGNMEPDAIYTEEEFDNVFGKISEFDTDKFLFILEDELSIVLCYYISDEMYENFLSTYNKLDTFNLLYTSMKTAIYMDGDAFDYSFIEKIYKNDSIIDEYLEKFAHNDEFYQFFLDDEKTVYGEDVAQGYHPAISLTYTRNQLKEVMASLCDGIIPKPDENESEGATNDDTPFHDDGGEPVDIRDESEKEEEKEKIKKVQEREYSDWLDEAQTWTFRDLVPDDPNELPPVEDTSSVEDVELKEVVREKEESNINQDSDDDMVLPVIRG